MKIISTTTIPLFSDVRNEFNFLHPPYKIQPLVKYGKWKHSTIDKVNIIIQSTKYIGRYSCLFNSTVDKIVMPTIIIAYELLINSQRAYSLANPMLLLKYYHHLFSLSQSFLLEQHFEK